MVRALAIGWLGTLAWFSTALAGEAIPEQPTDFLINYCLDCHDADSAKGEVNLDFLEISWEEAEARHHWERVLKVLESGEMPPEDKDQPAAKERETMVAWLDESLTKHSPIGGTVARRLNQEEYRNTVRALFNIPFDLPPGFPQDEIFPPVQPPAQSSVREVLPTDMVISYSSSSVRDGAMRLVSKSEPMSRSCTWPSKVEIQASGVYRIQLQASAFQPVNDEPMILEVLARDASGQDSLGVSRQRSLGRFEVSTPNPQPIELETELYEGETIVFYYANAPLDSDKGDQDEFEALLRKKFAEDPRELAAWQQIEHGRGIRGGLGWERVKALMEDETLDLSKATLDHPETEKLLKLMTRDLVAYVETISYDHFENGPGLDVHEALIEGPLRIVDGPADKARKRIQSKFLGEQGKRTEEEWTRAILQRFLTDAYRRPVEESAVDGFAELVQQHRAEGYSFEQGMHLAIRTALISPRFLYRALHPGPLDDYDLASRLSYFLTSRPPDATLLSKAEQGKLTDPQVLEFQALRLLREAGHKNFVESFTGQWLDTRLLPEIMPDPRLKFNEQDQRAAETEVEMFFTEMLQENRPMTDFIDPDFTFTTRDIAENVYGLQQGFDKKNKNVQRVSLPRGGRYGGILGQSGVLMATANGVDTQPVVRGVWVLENVLGMPPPPPPKAVPAITPDTTGAKTPRDLLAAHASEASCAGCHRKIDPIGFALENYDPVGRWRDTYPIYTTDEKGKPVTEQGAEIDASGTLPDGTRIEDAVALKQWIVENIDLFSACISEKLLTYATGRVPNYVERKEIAQIVEANHEKGNGFRDLMLALIQSETFRTK